MVSAAPGGVTGVAVDDVSVVGRNGGAVSDGDVLAAVGVADLSFSLAAIDTFHSLIASSSLADLPDTTSFSLLEPAVLALAFHSSAPLLPFSSRSFNLSKEPLSYAEAMAPPDASVWRAAGVAYR